MLEKDVNDIVFDKVPKPFGGKYRFNVMEVYIGQKSNGQDLTVSYFRRINAEDIMFKETEDGKYILHVKPDAFKSLEHELNKKLPHEVKIYPNFE
jgi:hypothetical protein